MAKSIGSQLNLQRIPVLGLVPEARSSAPATPTAGQLWYDTSVNRLKAYNGSGWLITDAADAIPLSQRAAANGVATLDGTTKIPIAQIPVSTTSSTTAVVRADDPRLADNRTPIDASVTGGTAGAGVKLAANTITDANVNAANKDGANNTPSMRTLGSGALQAMPGNTRLDQVYVPQSAVDMNNQRLANLLTPSSANDGANKTYVDTAVANARAGLSVKDPVIAVATTNVNLAAPGTTIDGVTLTSGQRFLATAQTTSTQNGIYVFNGSAAAATRSTDADGAGEVFDGTLVAVGQGTQAGTQWIQTATDPGTVPGNWTQTWTQFSSGGQTYTAGNGLTMTGSTIDVVAADGSITVTADAITVGLVPVAKGGTNATTAAAARTNLGAVGKYAADLGALTAGAETTITHNLGSLDVIASFSLTADKSSYELAWRVIDANSIGVTADIASSAAAVRAVVIG